MKIVCVLYPIGIIFLIIVASIVPLTVTVPVDQVSVNERENVTLTCLFNYKQSLLVLWRKDNNILYNGVYNEVSIMCVCVCYSSYIVTISPTLSLYSFLFLLIFFSLSLSIFPLSLSSSFSIADT